MLIKIDLSKVTLELKEQPDHQPSNQIIPSFWVTFRIKSSYSPTPRRPMLSSPPQPTIQPLTFQDTPPLFYQNEDETIEIKIYKQNSTGTQTLINLTESVRSFLKCQKISLHKLSPEMESLTYHCDTEKVPQKKTLSLKNILIELMPLVGKKKEMTLEVESGIYKYRVIKSHKNLFWNEEVKIYILGQDSVSFSLYDVLGGKTPLVELKLGLLQHESGFRKNLIKNELEFPIGCIQFEYHTEGLFAMKEKLKTVETKQLYKIEMNKVKGILKEEYSGMSMKIISDLNYFDSQKTSDKETSHVFEFETNNYIYSAEPKCNFTIFGTREGQMVVGNAIINLHMLGKFDRKVVFHQLDTHRQMGHLIVSITCLKVETKALRLQNICLKFDEDSKGEGEEFFIKGNVGGTFGKTEQKPFQRLISFTSNLQVRYSTETNVQMEIVSSKRQQPIFVNLNIQELETVKKNIIEKAYASQDGEIKGRTNLEFQYFPKVERDSKEEENKKIQVDPSTYKDHLEWCERQKGIAHKKIEQTQKISTFNSRPSPQREKPTSKAPVQATHKAPKAHGDYQHGSAKREEKKQNPSIKTHIFHRSGKSPNEIGKSKSSKKRETAESRYQHIMDIYLGDNRGSSKNGRGSRKGTPSSHRSPSYSSGLKKRHFTNELGQLPDIKIKGSSSGSRKLAPRMDESDWDQESLKAESLENKKLTSSDL